MGGASSCLPASSGLVRLCRGPLEVAVARPDAPGGYRGRRFAWAGVVAWARADGHTWFGPWRPERYPADHHDEVTGTAGEFGMDAAGMPAPLGFADAAPGGTFVKVGVGVLRRPDDAPYSFGRCYELVESPPWRVDVDATRFTAAQELRHGRWGYRYTYTLSLAADARFVTAHRLENLGELELHQTHYSHNFCVLPGEQVGPDWELSFPFAPTAVRDLRGLARLAGHSLRFDAPVPPGTALFTELAGYGASAADNAVTVTHHGSGAELRVTGDRPVTRYHWYATADCVCPEPFVDLRLAPGESVAWQHTYALVSRSHAR